MCASGDDLIKAEGTTKKKKKPEYKDISRNPHMMENGIEKEMKKEYEQMTKVMLTEIAKKMTDTVK